MPIDRNIKTDQLVELAEIVSGGKPADWCKPAPVTKVEEASNDGTHDLQWGYAVEGRKLRSLRCALNRELHDRSVALLDLWG